MKNRSAAIDALRVVGIVAIVFGHVWDSGSRLLVYPWHVALFFFLTGYLWNTERSLSGEVRKRWQTLLIPLLVWTLIIGLTVLGVMLVHRNFDVAETVEDIAAGEIPGRPFMVFWFVLVLFFVAVLLRSMQKLPTWAPWLAAVAGLALAYVNGSALSNTPLYVGLALPCLLFVLAGIAFRRNRVRVKPWMAWLMLAVSGVLIGGRVSAPMDMKPGDFGTPVLSVVVALAVCAALVTLAERHATLVPPAVGAFATALASCALVVILGHASIIFLTEGLPQIVVFALALVLPWAVGLIALRTPTSAYLTGVRTTKRQPALVV